mmetsp:Transcript_24192/g.50449  ORF Transcript_24192/g.50449 Transcript_24192/m.50449 type:complete len:248 (+) Transcript_24192:5496-6239(+)
MTWTRLMKSCAGRRKQTKEPFPIASPPTTRHLDTSSSTSYQIRTSKSTMSTSPIMVTNSEIESSRHWTMCSITSRGPPWQSQKQPNQPSRISPLFRWLHLPQLQPHQGSPGGTRNRNLPHRPCPPQICRQLSPPRACLMQCPPYKRTACNPPPTTPSPLQSTTPNPLLGMLSHRQTTVSLLLDTPSPPLTIVSPLQTTTSPPPITTSPPLITTNLLPNSKEASGVQAAYNRAVLLREEEGARRCQPG